VNEWTTIDAYGVVTEPATLTIQRVLPGPIERVWDYLTKSDLRRQWLAAGDMAMAVGAPFEFVWRNDELENAGKRPDGFSEEHRLESRITELDPPHRIGFEWGASGGVTIQLEEQSGNVLLTLIHRRLPDREMLLKVAAGWHAHLDVLAAKASGGAVPPFWANWSQLHGEYDRRVPRSDEDGQ